MRISMVLAGLVALSAVACGGSSEDGGDKGTAINTSVPADTKANELSQAQAEELCSAVEKAGEKLATDMKADMCRFMAWTFASSVGTADVCQDLYSECVKAPEKSDGAVDGDTCEKPSSTCTATVGEMETCWNDVMAATKTGLAQLPGCDDVGKNIDQDDLPKSVTPDSCKIVEQKCPEAMGSLSTPDLSDLGGVTDGTENQAPSAPGSNG